MSRLSYHYAGDPLYRAAFPKDALFFFDFDGVLATQCEEKVFRLVEAEGERDALEPLARENGIDPSLYPSTRYLRHLVYQAVRGASAVKRNVSMVEFMRELEEEGSATFVITARSSRNAVKRMMSFFDRNRLNPTEVFCLGRASKGHLLAELRNDWPERPFVFFEDSKYNIDACMANNDPLLGIVEVIWPQCMNEAKKLRSQHLGVE